ncbi:hypothetical protein BC332_13207 [Capsicum chinense]|nr:hypothetical protein BC332_13207 [Capsicum chinense]
MLSSNWFTSEEESKELIRLSSNWFTSEDEESKELIMLSSNWSNLCEDKFSPKYYHINDLALVIRMMKSLENIYGTMLSTIMKHSDTNCVATGSNRDLDSQLKTMWTWGSQE